MAKKPEIKMVAVESLEPYLGNARTHSERQIQQIANSITEFGFTNPLLTDGENGIIAGHGRLMGAKLLGMDKVPVIELKHLSSAQKRAYVIADNQIALNAGWDLEILKNELNELNDIGFDISITGFDEESLSVFNFDLDELGEGGALGDSQSAYTQKVQIPHYEPSDKCPDLDELIDRTKADSLRDQVKKAGLPEDLEKFLLDSAERFVEFKFDRIADFYAHSSPEIQELMENSALVIVDYQKAIELGFVKLVSDVDEAFGEEYPDA